MNDVEVGPPPPPAASPPEAFEVAGLTVTAIIFALDTGVAEC